MTQRSFLFGSVAGDRVYDPGAFARAFQRLIGTGVVEGDGNNLNVIQNAPAAMNVKVDLGSAFILGYFFEVYGAAEVVAIGAANPTNPRIDTVVVRRDLAGRTVALAVVAGVAAASPAAPALTQNTAGVYELPLADVYVPAAAVSIVTANITDRRAYGTAELGVLLDATVGHRHEGTSTTGRKVRYTDLTSVPATFPVDVHDHALAGSGGNVPWTSVSGKPATFTPTPHGHGVGSAEGQVAYAALTGVPATFAPSAHAAAHGAGGGDQVTVPWTSVSGKPATMPADNHDHGGGGGIGNVPWGNVSGKPGTFTPANHYHDTSSYTGIYWAWIYDKPATYAPSSHALSSHTGSVYDIGGLYRNSAGGGAPGVYIWVGTTDPGGSAAEGDIWVKG